MASGVAQDLQENWEDFGQKVDLTQRIREVLQNYPEGTTILKELIQNADDSGASKVIVCLDRRHHGTERLAYGGLAPFQGPALLVYNNSIFTEEDFESISRVGGSKKRTQAGKTGRFGIGFNVVYHLTDLPSFVSGQHLVYFDPHCAHLPRVNAANPGKRLDFVRTPASDSQRDQFAPYKVFGCDMARPFNGTLFRFPLRTSDLAAVSRISRQAYSVQGMSELLSEFKSEAVPSLLFLKHVESIDLFDWAADAAAPTKLFTCELENLSPEIHRHRQVFSQIARNPLPRTPVSDVFALEFRNRDESNGGEETHEVYLISQYMAGSQSAIGAIKSRAEKEYDLYLLPWTSIAARLDTGNDAQAPALLKGRAFCFLPLPMTTDLPVHVNGYFELSSNRRDLWMGLDMEGSGRLRSEWNRTLLSDVCTAAYAQLLHRATTQLGPSSAYYALFPANRPAEPWSLLVAKLYQALANVPILHTSAVDSGAQRSDSANAVGRWVTPREALFRDEEFARGAELTSALVSEGLPVVEPPLGPRALLLEYATGGQATVCMPALVRAHLRGGGVHRGLERRENALTFLEYCLEDVLDDEAGDHLVNLQLIPLSDGSLGRFARRSRPSGQSETSGADFVLPASELEARLLSGVPHRVVDGKVDGPLGERLRSIAASGGTNVRTLTAPTLGQLLSDILPKEWRGKRNVAWEVLGANAELDPSEREQELRLFTQRDEVLRAQSGRRVSGALVVELSRQPSVNWLSDLWRWLGEKSRGDVRTFSDWPLLPTSDGGLCQLSLASAVVGPSWESLEGGTAGSSSRGYGQQRGPLRSDEGVSASEGNVQQSGQSNSENGSSGVSDGIPLRRVITVLKKLGCRFLHPGGAIPVAEHPLASQFLHAPTASGILSAFSAACESDGAGLVSQRVAKLDVSERASLRRFFTQPRWWSGAPVQPTIVNIVRSLPIFETYGSSSGGLVALESSRVFLSPKDVDEALLGESFLKPASANEARILAGSLGVPVLGRAAFYRTHVFGRILGLPADVRNKSMLAALRDLPGLCSEDSSFREIISRLPFVPAGGRNGEELLPPSALYDPRVEELVLLLEGARSSSGSQPPAAETTKTDAATNGESSWRESEEGSGGKSASPTSSGFFPRGEFATPQVLDALRFLGLKTSVSQETVLAAARAVEQLAGSDPESALLQGRAILEYLEVHGQHWTPGAGEEVRKAFSKFGNYLGLKEARASETGLEKFWSDLGSTQWCPVMVTPPDPSLPWPSVTGTVSAPRFCRPASDMWLVSASLRILDGECRSAALAHQLGWDKSPGPAVLAAQLLELGKRHARVGGRAVGRQLAAAIPRIYTLLHQLLGREEMDIVKAVLEGSAWVWVGDGFAAVDQVAFTGPLNLAPYFFVIPSDLSAFRELLSELGVRDGLAPRDYARVLARMAADTAGTPLQDAQLSMAIWLVQQLADAHLLAEDAGSGIHVPDAAGVLAPAGELVYNDAPWLEGFGGAAGLAPAATASSSRFVHAKVSHEVAERVGVRSLRRLLLAANADSMDLAVGTAEAFGQHEALTVRLKHIVEMYADGPGILCELVQNADDAGATSVAIVLDRERYGASSILSPRMAAWQGPALLCYNNAQFTPRDLHNISRIGQDSKLEKPAAIGRFGLGFNSVYHLTDVPSFVSGEYLVFFDPHASHLPGVSPSHPGLKIGFVGRGLTQQFPDQFRPYLRFGCDLQHRFPGTLFRFPLRSPEAARKSEIKQEPCDIAALTELLYSFRSTAIEALLFLRSVRSISVYIRDRPSEPPANPSETPLNPSANPSENLELLYKVERAPSLQEDPQQAILSFIRGGGRDVVASKDAFLLRLQRAAENGLPGGCAKVDILTTGTPRKEDSPSPTPTVHTPPNKPDFDGGDSDKYNADVILDVSRAGANKERAVERTGQSWLVCNRLGGGRARAHALAAETRGRGFVPWAGVAARLDAEIAGRAFCFLPLPVTTQLPVHTNGYFELSSNRRDIWQGTDHLGTRSNIKSEWNTCLLEDVAAPAYAQLLVHAVKQLGPTPEYSRLWPVGDLRDPWSRMAGKLYEAVVDLPVLPTKAGGGLGRWITPRQAVFPDFPFGDMGPLGAALVAAGMPLVDVSPEVCAKFQQSCPSLRFLTPQLLRRQLAITGGRRPKLTDRATVVMALKYCLQGLGDTPPGDLLLGLPLLPLADGSLGTFGRPSEGPIFLATPEEYAVFASKVPRLFLEQGPVVSEETRKVLEGLAEAGGTNLRVLSAADVASSLLPKILPAGWERRLEVEWRPPADAEGFAGGFDDLAGEVSDNPDQGSSGHPSVKWMTGFWKWLGAKGGLELFTDWPLIPTSGGTLCKPLEINPAPGLEDGFDLDPERKPFSVVVRGEALNEGVVGLLLIAGCQLLRSEIVGTNPVLNQFVHSSTATGVLGALSEAATRKGSPLTELLEAATPSQKQETRAFLCQSKWFNQSGASSSEPQQRNSSLGNSSTAGDSLSTAHLRILAALPIFEAYTGAETTSASVNRLFVDLASKPRFFPPPGVPESLLSVNFLRCENESERALLGRHLGVESLGRAAFFSDHVFGRPEILTTDVGRRAMLAVLADLPSLAAENPGLRPKLTRLAFVPTGAGTLAAPADLYDPGVNELHTLLDRGAFFPSEEFQRPEVLEVLRGLGLRRAMGRKGLLDSARSVEMRAGSDVREAVKRGRALLQHLDDLERAAEPHVAPGGSVPTATPADDAPGSNPAGTEPVQSVNLSPVGNAGPPSPAPESDLEEGAFWTQLAGISWCPILEESPDVRLPWRNLGGPLAPSKFVRPKEDAWLVSSGLRLLDGEVKSANLKTKLGWGDPPGVNVLAGQLLELGKMYPRVEDEGLAEILGGAVSTLYTALQNVVATEEFEVVRASLEGSNCVWVGNGFVSARSIAFESPANFHPYLYTIPSELAPHRRLLEALEVRKRFAARDYAQMLFRMARDANGEPLPSEQLNVVFRVLDVLADDPGPAQVTSILLPDKTGRLSRAEDLVFNDASWLAGDAETGPRLVHPDVSNEVAEKLGARSLRYMFLVDQEMTSDVPCPGLELTRAVTDEPKLVLFDLLEVADVAGARRVEILIDGREHPRQSLLQPNLAPFQGPGVVFRMDGPPLSVQELSALFASPPAKLRGRNCTYGSALLSCFSLTDLPFIASGGLLYMFDPQGNILTASPTGEIGKRKGPTGKAYSLTGTDLVTRFADQLAPLGLTPDSQSGLAVTQSEGTVIRLPLRVASENQPGASTDVREAVDFFQEHVAPSLLFLRTVEEVAVRVYQPGSDRAQEVLRCAILPQHVELRQPFQDQQKKRSKFAISSLFSGQSSVVRTNRIAVETSSAQNPQPVLDEWLVVQALGSGKTRDMSLDRKYLSLNLVPVGGVAAHVMRDGMPIPHPAAVSAEPERGSNGGNVGGAANGGAENSSVAHERSSDGGEGWAHFEEREEEGRTPNGDSLTLEENEGTSSPSDAVREEPKLQSLPLDFTPSSRIPHASAVHLGLPICGGEGLPVILSGHFLPAKTTSGRQLFQRGVNAPPHSADPHQPSPDFLRLNWNRELLLCVREAYVELLVHLHRASNPQTSQPQRPQGGNGRLEPVMVPPMTPERLYSYWPRFTIAALTGQPDDSVLAETLVRPMYGLLAQLPLFLLQTGVRAKIGEGMFLAPPAVQERQGVVPPASVLQFLHQHYQVFAVPWEIRDELHGAGVSTSDLTPKMLRSLLRSPTAAIHQLPDPHQALLTQVDLLEYCCADLILKPDPLALEPAPDQNGVSREVGRDNDRERAPNANGGERLPRAEELGRGEQEAAIRAQAAELRRITQGATGPAGGPPRGVALVSQSAFAPDIDRLFGAGSARAADTFVASIAGAIAAGGGPGAQANGPPARRAPDAPVEEVVRDADGNVVRIDGQKVTELIGVRCPAASGEMFRLGGEAFLATPAQENLLPGLAPKFVHSLATQRGSLSTLFSHPQFRGALNLKLFTQQLLAANLGSALPKVWAIRGTPIIVPWDSHPHALPSAPSPDWLKRLWREVGANGDAPRGAAGSAPDVAHLLDGGMFGRWHLLPAVQGAQTVLVRGDQKDLVFYPPAELDDNGPFLRDLGASEIPPDNHSDSEEETDPLLDPRRNRDSTSPSQPAPNETSAATSGTEDASTAHDVSNPRDASTTADVSTPDDVSIRRALTETAVRYPRLAAAHPWLLPLLRSIGVPIFDTRFRGVCERLVKPPPGKDVAQLLLARLGALQQARVLDVSSLTFTPSECDSLVSVFAGSYGPDRYTPADVTLLKSLPIYKTAHTGDHVSLPAGGPNPYCTVPPAMFLKPRERVLEYRADAGGLFAALGVKELTDADVMAEHALPEFGVRSREERDRTLGHLQAHWARFKQVPAVVAALKETAFVPSAGPSPDGTERSLHKPSDLLDPSNTLLRRVFFDEPERFAGGEFASERWLPILRDAGLRSSMDGSLYLECGKRIEARAKGEVRSSAAVLPPVTSVESRFRRTDNRAPVSGNPSEAEATSGGTDRELLEVAGLLIEKMLGEFANVFGPAFCEAFSQIGCVPAERIIFKDVRTGRGGARTTSVRTVLASYQESVLSKDWALAWSSAPVLKSEQVIPPAFAWGALKLRSPPAYATVVAHLKTLGQNGGEDVLARWGGITGARTAGGHVSVEDAFLAVFRFLDSKWDGLSVSERGFLRGVPFIPVANGTRLVAPDRLYARARTDLTPFAFELPRLFTPYLRVLEGLGTGDAPTSEGLLKLIAEVAHAAGGERLNPNELHAVLRILTLASEELGSVRSRGLAVRKERIVVPDEGARLQRLDDVICADAAGASLVNEIDGRKVRLTHPLLLEDVAARLGVRKLSESVEEELDQAWFPEHLPSLGTFSRDQIASRLQAPDFVKAATALVHSHAAVVPSLRQVTRRHVAAALASAADGLRLVKTLSTRLVLLPSREDVTLREEWPEALPQEAEASTAEMPPESASFSGMTSEDAEGAGGSEFTENQPLIARVPQSAQGEPGPLTRPQSRAYSSVPTHDDIVPPGASQPPHQSSPTRPPRQAPRVHTPSRQRTVYEFFDQRSGMLFIAAPPSYLPLQELFSGALSRLLSSPVPLPLGALLFAPPGEVIPLCRALRVPLQEMTDEEGARQRDAQRSGAPGEKLLLEDLPLVQCHPLRPYHAGEVVAWQPGPSEAGVLRYGRIAQDVRAPSGQALYYVALETRPGHVQDLLSSAVFSFRSASSPDGGPVPGTAEQSRAQFSSPAASMGPFAPRQEASRGAENGAAAIAGTAAAAGGGAMATAGGRAATAGSAPVKPSEVVQAVADMLAAADLPLGLEEGALMERALGLQEQLGAAETLLEGAESRVCEAQREVEAAKSAWTCKVCLGEEVTSALVPCGHLFCTTCGVGVGGRCPFCRRPVSSILRIYKP